MKSALQARERLARGPVVETIERGLGRHLDRPAVLVVGEPLEAPDAARRVTHEEVREDTLKALIRQERRLERAVQELDLELMD